MSSALIDVAIGLVVLYLVLSLICTAANEFVANVTSLRARTLAASIHQLVDEGTLLKRITDHGLIDGAGNIAKTKAGPSYLSSTNFARALLASLTPDKPTPGVDDIKKAIVDLPDSNIKDSLQAVVAEAGDDLTRLRNGVASWFDDAMDRVSGVYKRRIHWIGVAVGLLIAVALNADSVLVARTLWSDSSLRSELSQVASRIVSSGPDVDKPDGATAERAIQGLQQLEQIRPFPLGWDSSAARLDANWSASPGGWLQKIGGWLLTALAITLGAPFWFDMLSNFVRLRTTGDKPDAAASASK